MYKAFVRLTYLLSYEQDDFDLPENCSKADFADVVDDTVNQMIEEMYNTEHGICPNDVEIEIVKEEEE